MFQKHVCPCKRLEKSNSQTIDSSSKNDMYIMDFPTAPRLRHKKMTAPINYHFNPITKFYAHKKDSPFRKNI